MSNSNTETETLIPALSMWKMFSDTVPELYNKMENNPEDTVQRLTNIINSDELSNIFVFPRPEEITNEEYELITDKYKSFTVWLLGRFFHFLNFEELQRIHDVIINTQLRILRLISLKQPKVYKELTLEYASALKDLTNYLRRKCSSNIYLKVFTPQQHLDLPELNLDPIYVEVNSNNVCKNILQKVLKFFNIILRDWFLCYTINDQVLAVLDDLEYIMSCCDISLKISAIEVFVNCVGKVKNNFQKNIIEKFLRLCSLFEIFTYEVYNNRITLDCKHLVCFEGFLIQFLQSNDLKNKNQICNFVFKRFFFERNDLKTVPSKLVLDVCLLSATKINTNEIDFDSVINLFFEKYEFNCVGILQKQIVVEFEGYYAKKLSRRDGELLLSKVFLNFQRLLKESKNRVLKDVNKYLELICEVIDLFVKISILLKQKMNQENSDYLAVIGERFEFFEIFSNCIKNSNISNEILLKTMAKSAAFSKLNDLLAVLDIIAYSIFQRPSGEKFQKFYNLLQGNKCVEGLETFYQFLCYVSTDLCLEKEKNYQLKEKCICIMQLIGKQCLNEETSDLVVKILSHGIFIYPKYSASIQECLLPMLTSENILLAKPATTILPLLLTSLSSNYFKSTEWNSEKNMVETKISYKQPTYNSYTVCEKISGYSAENILKNCFKLFKSNNVDIQNNMIECLPIIAQYTALLSSVNIFELFMMFASSENKNTRKTFCDVIDSVLINIQENQQLSQENKQKILEIFYSTLEKLTKKSLQYFDLDLQQSILEILRNVSKIKHKTLTKYVLQLLLYFMILPNTGQCYIAVSIFSKISEIHEATPSQIYSKFQHDLGKTVAELCVISHYVIGCDLTSSLEKVFQSFGYFSSRDFVCQECPNLLPYFVSLVVKMPKVDRLIREMAQIMEISVQDLVANHYGYVFLHVFFSENDGGKKAMQYMEMITGNSGSELRKMHRGIILNKSLMNFHENREQVLRLLHLLVKEDEEKTVVRKEHVLEYLQPMFRGVLQYFDRKLTDNNFDKVKQVFVSLSDLFPFLGAKFLAPLRFKIIAMLQTELNPWESKYPEIKCNVWDSFIRSNDVKVLGSQLATIFVSLVPLLEFFPQRVNGIFRYLIIENEKHLQENIRDLFFMLEMNIDLQLKQTIKKHTKKFSTMSLKEQIRLFIKYLTHESADVRMHGLKYVKKILAANREELDQMILGYNGIDPVIVELVEILTKGCKEKDTNLKIMFADVIGELGAIEPSHLPRRYAQNSQMFTFFLDDDEFVVHILTELSKALQAEKNTKSIDRFALAIQEILKAYQVSPDSSSPKHYLWDQFSEPQKELMSPLLSSKYTVSAPIERTFPSPIYGSSSGESFKSWIVSWTSNLISALPEQKKALLMCCLPSMRQNTHILMEFLPYILLHVLIEGEANESTKTHKEISTVADACYYERKIDKNLFSVRRLYSSKDKIQKLQMKNVDDNKKIEYMKVIFVLLDFLDRWLREWQWRKGVNGRNDRNFKKIQDFFENFNKMHLSKCNFKFGEYSRALVYFEEHVKKFPDEMRNYMFYLAQLYAELDEPDGVAGVMALQQSEPSLEQRILALEVSGKLSDAATCYETMKDPLQVHHFKGWIQCYLGLDHVNTALKIAQAAMEQQNDYGNMLLELQAEPFWRLTQFDDLETLLKSPELNESKNWGVNIGRALLHFRKRERDLFKQVLDDIKLQEAEIMETVTLEEGYEAISRLHAINELEQMEFVANELILKSESENYANEMISRMVSEWELRIKIVQETTKITEPILCLRRVVINQTKNLVNEKVPSAIPLLNSALGECYLMSAKTARAARMHQQAYIYTLKAEEYSPPKLFLEKAKLHWLRNEREQALTTLRRGLEKLLPNAVSGQSPSFLLNVEERKICAEAKLLIASYNDEVSNVDTDTNIQHYKEAVEMFKEWEKSLVYLAQYYDRIFSTFSDEDRDSGKGSDMQIHMINCFGKSLQYGSCFVYQSMPRLLSIWFDYGTRLLEVSSTGVRDERKGNLLKMTKLIDSFLERLPAYIFLTAFSQIVSRICHPQREVYIELKAIIIKLLLQYPQQTLWMIISVIKSSYSVRSKRCAEVFNDSRLKTPSMVKLVRDFTAFAEKLIELCNKEISDNVSTVSVSSLTRSLPRLLTKDDFSEIMMPVHKFRKLVLPNPDLKNAHHNPFPNHYVHIVGIEDEVSILPSLQRPRRITLRGSDGKGYIQMLKPKDDLRKDFRLMEFNDIVNQLLSRDSEARQRRLNIRLYSVAPLNEECGLIEWVPNLVGLRPILVNLYKQKGLHMRGRELKEMCCNLRDPLAKKRDIFVKQLLPKHPPVLGEWFRRTFPDAQSWLTARTAYIRTTAVMSMVGYILGLGDRHGENILFDSICGDVVHVDFNCLFNKGETFEWPERVPFRLTQNMVAAMGPLGVEGFFRKAGACTLRVLRSNANILMSIVTPFVYDPLVSWPRNNLICGGAGNAERTNEQAVDHIKNIELRLQGVVKLRSNRSFSALPLSVEGQTNHLIEEAMNIDNLCQMYIGWGPYL